MLRVVATGPLAIVQDAGRPGLAHLGLGCSGAADPVLMAAANGAVGNPPHAPVVEVLHGGLVLRAAEQSLVAVAGDEVTTHVLAPGAELVVGPGAVLRQYVAIAGGVAAPSVLGSCSYDTRNGLGPAPLAAGDELVPGEVRGTATDPPGISLPTAARLHPGPRADWFHPGLLDLLVAAAWTVSATSDRTAVRLEGPHLARRVAGDLEPEGLRPGAVQVPPSGQPIVFLPDHPVTGGYPVVAVVERSDLRLLAQTRPAGQVRFSPTW